tara:strand:+ start:1767 stop:3305 length:1539 start_codon:yes stop_codon:yes gene_type:complete
MPSYTYKILISLFIVLFFFYLTFFLSNNYFPLDRHWTAFYDHELTLTYNALLFNSGKLHEYVDHSGYFTILFLSIFFKLLSFIDLLSVYNITIFNQNNNLDQDLQNLLYFTRLFGILSISIFCLVAFWTFNLFSKDKLLSFLITTILFLSIGTYSHFFQLRTELISMIFFMMSFFCLSFLFLKKQNSTTKYLIFFFLLLFCGILNKAQVFFYLPIILLIIYFIKAENNINFNYENYKFLENKHFLHYFFLLIIIYFLLKLSTGTASFLSILFIFLNILFINIFFYLKFKINKIEAYKNLKIINLFLVISYILLRLILSAHPSTNELAFNNTFTEIISNTFKYTSISNDGDKSFFYLIIEIIKNFKNHLYLIFGSLNYYSALISILLFLNLLNKKNKSAILFNLVCIFSFFLISAINGLRSDNNNLEIVSYYFIFSDFFLILAFTSFKELFNKKFFLILIPILVLIFYLNYPIIKSISIPKAKIEALCNDTYFYDWQKAIPPLRFKEYCEKNL